jgi:hypothetical protein
MTLGIWKLSRTLARSAPALAITLALAGPITILSAQNLLANPDFDTSLTGWQAIPAGYWDAAMDADGSPTSGSARVSTGTVSAGVYPILSQCVPLTLGTTYSAGGKIYNDGSVGSDAFFTITFYRAAGCTGPALAPTTTPAVATANAWTSSGTTFTNTFAGSAQFSASVYMPSGDGFVGNFDDTYLITNGCVPGAETLCLQNARFRVTATFDTGAGASPAQTVPIGDSGYLWFFSADNIEAFVKLIDGCNLNGELWFFAAGLTNVNVAITVTDTETGAVKTYTNPAGTPFQPIQDTSAFSCT